jgi:hypothetical protein
MTRFLLLILAAVCYGVFAALIFHRLAKMALLFRVANRLVARVMEFRLFIDEPALILRAQLSLIRDNVLLFRCIALPLGIAATSFLLLYRPLDRYFGAPPLRVGETVVVTAPLSLNPVFPSGVIIETPAVRVPRKGEVSWRIHVERESQAIFHTGLKISRRDGDIRDEWMVLFFTVSGVTSLLVLGISRR